MTTYKELFGKYVQNYASDPTSTDAEGQIWYNSTSGTFKTALGGYAVWSAGGNVGSSFYQAATGGTQTAAYKAGGGFPRASTASESYNGTSWTTAGSLNTARSRLSQGVVGTQTAGLGTGGYNTSLLASVEAFNGSSWTSVTSMPGGRQSAGASGIQTAALVFGGSPSPTSSISYNGSVWASAPNMVTGGSLTGVGTQTATLAVSTITESYNGTAWTAGTTLTTPRSQISGGGIQTSSIFSGGTTPAPTTVATTEEWNGTSWSTKSNLATARRLAGNHGTASNNVMTSSGINAPGSQVTSTEIYNVYGVSVPVAGSWSSGGNMNTTRRALEGTGNGIQTAAIIMGGYNTANVSATELYNGSAWTTSPATLNTTRRKIGSFGTQTATLAAGGTVTAVSAATESYNGTSWTTVNSMNSSKEAMGVFGIQTAGIVAGGSDASGPGFTNATESWNGTSWTTLPATINTTRADIGAFGIQSAGIIAFGSPQTAATESWNGSSWTSVNSGNTARIKPASSKNGTQTAGIVAGGSNPSVTGATELWNGTSWTTQASMATARNALAGAGTQSLGLVMGGDPTNGGATTTATEAWTGPSTTLNYKTLTTS